MLAAFWVILGRLTEWPLAYAVGCFDRDFSRANGFWGISIRGGGALLSATV